MFNQAECFFVFKHCEWVEQGVDSGQSQGTFKQEASTYKGGVMGFLAWIIVGLIAGWLAGLVMKGGGYGILVDIILGLLGGLLGGWLFGQLGIWSGGGMVGSIIVAFIGAVILVGITRLIKRA
jgi:uncharacterized membrane protein YeaQ/YmgE (transglycosylase-associated protein family)